MMVTAATMMLFFVCQFFSLDTLALHGCDQLLAGQLIPGRGDQGSLSIVLANQRNGSIKFFLLDVAGTGQNDGGGSFDLIIIELAKVLHIHLYLACIRNGHSIAQFHIVTGNLLHSCHNIGQLAHTAGLNDHPIGIKLLNHFLQCFTEITHQAAANTAGVHFCDVDTGILQKAAVNADLTKFIFDEHQLLSLVALLDHFLDKCCFASTKKTGINIDFCHKSHTFIK